jgi:hypothetical protein
LGAESGGGDRGSFSSGIVSCAVPFKALDVGAGSLVGSGLVVPLGRSTLDLRVCLGEDASEARGVEESRLRGLLGRPDGPEDEPGASRSFDLPLPKPPNGKFDDDLSFLSGEDARPYGCSLLRRFRTVPNRLRPEKWLFFSCTSLC